MNKKLIALAVAGTFAGYGAVASASTTVSGFTDIIYSAVNDSAAAAQPCTAVTPVTSTSNPSPNSCGNSSEGKFNADAEIDVISTVGAVTVRVDVDLQLSADSGDSGSIEQALFAWDLGPATLIGGVFNNPIGQEAEDAPDINFTSHSVVYNILDQQTALAGNNVAGAAVAGAIGPVTLTGALLNDINQSNEENSLALVANYSPIAGLDLEAGFVTQAAQADSAARLTVPTSTVDAASLSGATIFGSAEDVANFNVAYSIAGATVGLDYMTAGAIVDSAYTIWGGYEFGQGFAARARLENVSWDSGLASGAGIPTITGLSDSEAITFYFSYQATPNLLIALEVKDGDTRQTAVDGTSTSGVAGALEAGLNSVSGLSDGNTTTLEFIATF